MNMKAMGLFVSVLFIFGLVGTATVSAETYTNPAGIVITKELVTINGTKYWNITTNVTLDNPQEFWDIYKISAALHLMNSPRIYVAENWNFYLATKSIKVPIRDPTAGLSYIAARSIQPATSGKTLLKVIQHSPSAGSMFMGVWNPSPDGFGDVYSVNVWYFLYDRSFINAPNGLPAPYKCTVVELKRDVTVPSDAVVYDDSKKEWVAKDAGKKAKSMVVFKCGLGEWHDGTKITPADYMYAIAMDYEWSHKSGANDPFYDPDWDSAVSDTLSKVLGFKITKVTDDYVEIAMYQDYDFKLNDMIAATGIYYPSVAFPWEDFNIMTWMVGLSQENKTINGKKFSWSTSGGDTYQIDAVNPDQMPYFQKAANIILSDNKKLLPIWLTSLEPWLKKWGISPDQAGINTQVAKTGTEAIIDWISKHDNAVISDGPYYIDRYDAKNLKVILKKFTGKRVLFAGKIPASGEKNAPMVDTPTQPHFDEIDFYGTSNDQTAMIAVAKGEYDLFYYNMPGSQVKKVYQEYPNSLQLIKSIASWWSIGLNPVHNKDNPYLITVNNQTYFNPFAIPKVRFALNWLISRNYIVNTFLGGSGAPMYGPETSGAVLPYLTILSAAKALGITAQGDPNYAMKLIDEAMKEAASSKYLKGHTLEKKNGVWTFDGKPITLTFIIRSDDPRRQNVGNYMSSLLEKAGFKIKRELLNGRKAIPIVYFTTPYSYQWNLYTEGWRAGGYSQYPLGEYYWVDYQWAPTPAGGFTLKNTYTLEDLFKLIGNGDVNAGFQKFGLKYFNTMDKIKPLLDWTGYDFDMLGYLATWGKSTLVKYTPTTTSSTTTTTSTTTTSTTTTTTSSTTSSSTSSSASTTSTTSSGGGGICGPAFIVALAAIPLLLRKRK